MEAQVALVLSRLSLRCNDSSLAEVSGSILERLAALQDIDSPYLESYGSISGSKPFWGLYCPFKYLKWAANFYVDALLLHLFKADVQKPSTLRVTTGDRVQ